MVIRAEQQVQKGELFFTVPFVPLSLVSTMYVCITCVIFFKMTGVTGLVLLLEPRQPMGYRETCGEGDSNSVAAGYRPFNTPLSHVTAPGIGRVL